MEHTSSHRHRLLLCSIKTVKPRLSRLTVFMELLRKTSILIARAILENVCAQAFIYLTAIGVRLALLPPALAFLALSQLFSTLFPYPLLSRTHYSTPAGYLALGAGHIKNV